MASKSHIPESVLVRIWEEQCFILEDLKITTGLPIQVIRRGWRNHDNGPDFKNVLIRIGNQVYAGDVELHLKAADWATHGHDSDPNYNGTILHVVLWESEHPDRLNPGVQTSVCQIRKANGEKVPTAIVQHCLTDPLERLLERFRYADDCKHQRMLSCRRHIGGIPLEHILTCLRQLGRERLHERARRFEEWELHPPMPPSRGEYPPIPLPGGNFATFQQLLYETICEGLGYSSNKRPFVELARRLPIALIFSHLSKQDEGNSTKYLHWIQAMLFGVSGLLPLGAQTSDSDDVETIEYVTKLRSLWEMLQPCFDVVPMKPEEWHFFRLRPPNFPTRRIAALSYLLLNYTIQPLFENYLRLFTMFSEHPERETQQIRLLERTLEVPAAGYWKGRYRFGKLVFPAHDRVFIGKSRVWDILISAVFPVLLLYALSTEQTNLEAQILKLYEIFPSPERNRLTKTISEQLFGHRDAQLFNSPLDGGVGECDPPLEGGVGGCKSSPLPVRVRTQTGGRGRGGCSPLEGGPGRYLHTASIYQGMLHLYKHYCYLPACTECPFGETL